MFSFVHLLYYINYSILIRIYYIIWKCCQFIQIVFNACCGVILALLAFFSGWRWLPWTIRRVAARKERRAAKRLAKKAAEA